MKYAVFISSIPLMDEEQPDMGIPVAGLTTNEIVQAAQDSVGDLWAQDGPPEPWILDEKTLGAIEMILPKDKHE